MMKRLKTGFSVGLAALFVVFASGVDPLFTRYSEISRESVEIIEMFDSGRSAGEVLSALRESNPSATSQGRYFINGEDLVYIPESLHIQEGALHVEVRTQFRWMPLFRIVKFSPRTMVSIRNR